MMPVNLCTIFASARPPVSVQANFGKAEVMPEPKPARFARTRERQSVRSALSVMLMRGLKA